MNTSRLQTGHVLRKQLSYPETAFPVITSILPGVRGLGELPINLKALLWNNNASLPPRLARLTDSLDSSEEGPTCCVSHGDTEINKDRA